MPGQMFSAPVILRKGGLDMKEKRRKAFRVTLPVMGGYLVLGAGFGILMKANGYDVLWSTAMSIFIYAGSMQYLAVGLLTGGASLLSVAITTLAVNARHLFYGLSMANAYRSAGKKRAYLIFSLTDETYSLVCSGDRDTDECFLISLFNHLWWTLGTFLGAVFSSFIPFDTAGIDFALTALFITVVIDQQQKTKDRIPLICGAASSLLFLLLLGKDRFIIPAMILIFLLLLIYAKKEVKSRE